MSLSKLDIFSFLQKLKTRVVAWSQDLEMKDELLERRVLCVLQTKPHYTHRAVSFCIELLVQRHKDLPDFMKNNQFILEMFPTVFWDESGCQALCKRSVLVTDSEKSAEML